MLKTKPGMPQVLNTLWPLLVTPFTCPLTLHLYDVTVTITHWQPWGIQMGF